MPGALSAFGILVSDVVKDYSHTVLWRVADKIPFARLEKEFAQLSQSAQRDFRAESWAGAIREQHSVDLRYRGQGYELSIPLKRSLLADFHTDHARRYGYCHRDREVELVTLRLRATVKSPQARIAIGHSKADSSPASSKLTDQSSPTRPERLPVIFSSKKLLTAIYERDQLAIGKRYSGPAVITEYSATTVVPPGMRFWLDDAGNLLVNVR
jgi:N-methylhydantoinase A